MHNIWGMSKQCFTLYSKHLVCFVFACLLFAPPSHGAITPERQQKKFFNLSAARAGKPGGVKIAHADSDFLPLQDRGVRRITLSGNKKEEKPVVRRPSYEALPDSGDAEREGMALEMVGELEEVRVNRSALEMLFPELRAVKKAEKVAHIWPLRRASKQYISSGFGMRKDPFTGKPAFHQGIDIAAPTGTQVVASADGLVEEVGEHKRLGKFVKVGHANGDYTLYGHLSAARVREGMEVLAGQVLGAVGSTGRSTGPHLDFSLRREGEAIDPLPHLNVPRSIKSLELFTASE